MDGRLPEVFNKTLNAIQDVQNKLMKKYEKDFVADMNPVVHSSYFNFMHK